MKNKKILTPIFFITILTFALNTYNCFAQGNLVIMPRRIVLDDSKKIAQMSLSNSGADTAKYLISVIQFRMLSDGRFEQISVPDSGQLFADQYFRFFPKSVTLAPNESQTVKLEFIGKGNIPDGEYRSHLYFRAVPNVTALANPAPTPQQGVSVLLQPIFGISIPVVLRKGDQSVKVDIQAKLNTSQPDQVQLNVNFIRSGNTSSYGDLVIEHISPKGKISKVGLAKGLAVYTPNRIRDFVIPLDKNQGVNYSLGSLRITYTSSLDLKNKVLAQTEIQLH